MLELRKDCGRLQCHANIQAFLYIMCRPKLNYTSMMISIAQFIPLCVLSTTDLAK